MDEMFKVVKIRFRLTMNEGPITDGTLSRLDHGTKRDKERFIFQRVLIGKIQPVTPGRFFLRRSFQRSRRQIGLFHSLPVRRKTVKSPIPARRQIDFIVGGFHFFRGEEAFKTSGLPQFVSALVGDGKIRETGDELGMTEGEFQIEEAAVPLRASLKPKGGRFGSGKRNEFHAG